MGNQIVDIHYRYIKKVSAGIHQTSISEFGTTPWHHQHASTISGKHDCIKTISLFIYLVRCWRHIYTCNQYLGVNCIADHRGNKE